jgi:hypothetical protein
MHRTAIGCWLSRGSRVLFPPMVVVVACSACLRSLPEWTPMKDASPAPGNAWKLRPDQLSAPLPAEPLPGTPPALERFAAKLSLPQFIDVTLQISLTTCQPGGQARAAAVARTQARSSDGPTLSANLSGLRSEGGSAAGMARFAATVGQGELSYLLLDLGSRSAEVEAVRRASFNANWNHDQRECKKRMSTYVALMIAALLIGSMLSSCATSWQTSPTAPACVFESRCRNPALSSPGG